MAAPNQDQLDAYYRLSQTGSLAGGSPYSNPNVNGWREPPRSVPQAEGSGTGYQSSFDWLNTGPGAQGMTGGSQVHGRQSSGPSNAMSITFPSYLMSNSNHNFMPTSNHSIMLTSNPTTAPTPNVNTLPDFLTNPDMAHLYEDGSLMPPKSMMHGPDSTTRQLMTPKSRPNSFPGTPPPIAKMGPAAGRQYQQVTQTSSAIKVVTQTPRTYEGKMVVVLVVLLLGAPTMNPGLVARVLRATVPSSQPSGKRAFSFWGANVQSAQARAKAIFKNKKNPEHGRWYTTFAKPLVRDDPRGAMLVAMLQDFKHFNHSHKLFFFGSGPAQLPNLTKILKKLLSQAAKWNAVRGPAQENDVNVAEGVPEEADAGQDDSDGQDFGMGGKVPRISGNGKGKARAYGLTTYHQPAAAEHYPYPTRDAYGMTTGFQPHPNRAGVDMSGTAYDHVPSKRQEPTDKVL